MEVLYARCAGLDVHKDMVMACTRIADGGKVTREVKTFGTTTSSLLELGEWLVDAGCTHVVMEATGVYWKPVWHVLEGSFELTLANAQHVRNVPGRKSDVNGATWLADLLAHGLIRGSFVPPTPVQQMRDLTRTRKQLVREVAQHTQRIQKTLEDANVKLSSVISNILGVTARSVPGVTAKGRSSTCTPGPAMSRFNSAGKTSLYSIAAQGSTSSRRSGVRRPATRADNADPVELVGLLPPVRPPFVPDDGRQRAQSQLLPLTEES